jgi:pyrroline-5-carboxylate reductase
MGQTIGFIGCGKMAQAMIGGMIRNRHVQPEQVVASARTAETLHKVRELHGIRTTTENETVAREADYLFLAVAPSQYEAVIAEVRHAVRPSALVITVAAGITMQRVADAFQADVKVVRTMPNTPSLVGAGMSALCANERVTEEELARVAALFRNFGEVEVVAEQQMDAIPSISASSPAYVYLMIEAMADGGVRLGLSRDQAYRLAAQAVLGAARMVLETGKHPGELKDQVCSPGGATIAAVSELESQRFRGAVLAAMESCYQRVKQLGQD